MLLARFLLLITVVVAPSSSTLAGPLAPPDLPDLVEKTMPGVVNVSSTTVTKFQVNGMDEFLRFWGVPQEHKSTSLGSGLIIDKEGFVLTNSHVVEHATEVTVTLNDKRQFRAKIIGKDQKTDVALLQIRDKEAHVPANLQPVPLGNSDTTRIGEGAFAVGNPFGLNHTVTLGIISAKDRTIGQGPFDNFIQTDASINPGNSGGPLFNLHGEVIGINTMIVSRTGQTAGLGFAIPIHQAKGLLPDLKRYGRIPRPWIGVQADRVTPQLKEYYGLPVGEGVIILNIVEGTPGHRVGLRQGDILVELDGTAVAEPYDVERVLAKHRPKDTVAAQVRRGRRKLELSIHLDELPHTEELPRGFI